MPRGSPTVGRSLGYLLKLPQIFLTVIRKPAADATVRKQLADVPARYGKMQIVDTISFLNAFLVWWRRKTTLSARKRLGIRSWTLWKPTMIGAIEIALSRSAASVMEPQGGRPVLLIACSLHEDRVVVPITLDAPHGMLRCVPPLDED